MAPMFFGNIMYFSVLFCSLNSLHILTPNAVLCGIYQILYPVSVQEQSDSVDSCSQIAEVRRHTTAYGVNRSALFCIYSFVTISLSPMIITFLPVSFILLFSLDVNLVTTEMGCFYSLVLISLVGYRSVPQQSLSVTIIVSVTVIIISPKQFLNLIDKRYLI